MICMEHGFEHVARMIPGVSERVAGCTRVRNEYTHRVHLEEKQMTSHSGLDEARRGAHTWFYKPQWYWFGPRTLWPFQYGHDEFARRTLLFGWTITGRVIIALWDCGDEDCRHQAIEDLSFEDEATTHGAR